MTTETSSRPLTLITGANSGIGYGTALGMARRDYQVVMLCRSREKGQAARRSIVEETGSGAVDLMLCDLSSQQQIRDFCADFHDRYSRLDVLVNNAALIPGRRTLTEDGIEYQWQVNYLAPFMLTLLLMDRLQASAPTRVVNLSSAVHSGGRIDFDDLGAERGYGPGGWGQYANTKLADVVFTQELARRLEGKGVTTYAVHPGMIGTELTRTLPGIVHALYKAIAPGPEKGAETSLYCATEPGIEDLSGAYFARSQQAAMAPRARDEGLGRRLWAVSLEMTGVDDPLK